MKRVAGFRGADLLRLPCFGTASFRWPDLFGLGFVMTMILIRMGSYILRITGHFGRGNGKHVAECC